MRSFGSEFVNFTSIQNRFVRLSPFPKSPNSDNRTSRTTLCIVSTKIELHVRIEPAPTDRQ